MDINYELYKMFNKVAKTGSFTKVAEENFISQSAVTQAMKKLENQLGGTLFVRSKSGVTLTPEGQTLYEYINNSLEVLNSAENLFSKYKNLEKGNLRIICGSTLVDLVLLKPLMNFIKDYPNVTVSVVNDISSNSLEKIANGKADIAIFNLPMKNDYENIKIEEIADANMCFFTSKKYYDKAIKKDFKIDKLDKYTLAFPAKGSNTRKWLDARLEERGLQITPQYEFSSGKVLVNFVANMDSIGYANIDLVKYQLNDKDFVILENDFEVDRKEVGIAYLNEKITSAAVIKFLKYIKNK